jgi:hypothetical protein
MSDTQPDRKEAGNAPEGPRNPIMRFIAWGVLAVVLYVLSTGPMWWLHRSGYIGRGVISGFLFPERFLSDPVRRVLMEYTSWWEPSSPAASQEPML